MWFDWQEELQIFKAHYAELVAVCKSLRDMLVACTTLIGGWDYKAIADMIATTAEAIGKAEEK